MSEAVQSLYFCRWCQSVVDESQIVRGDCCRSCEEALNRAYEVLKAAGVRGRIAPMKVARS